MRLLLLLACGGRTPDAELFLEALDASAPLELALSACGRMAEGADECVATVVRNHAEADSTPCFDIGEERWRAECHFTVAERHIEAGDRWTALRECGLSGRFYDECLYHMWSREMQATATPKARSEAVTRAVDFLEEGRLIVLFWSGIRSVAQDPEQLLWDDWWYFAHTRNKPADLSACDTLPAVEDQARCTRGTLLFVERTVTESVIRPSFDPRALDRACRALGDPEAPDDRPIVERIPGNIALGLYAPDPRLDEAALRGLTNACVPDVARPWNPVFRPVLASTHQGGAQAQPLPEGVSAPPTRPPPGLPEGVSAPPTRPPPPGHAPPGAP